MLTFHVSQSPMAATPPNRKFARISATHWLLKTKLGHVHRDSVWSGQNKFGVICPLGGAIINKIAFLAHFSLCKNHHCYDTPGSSSVCRDLAWELEGRWFESCDWWRRFRCELISWELFDVFNYSIDRPISMGPALLLAAIFGAHAAKLQGTCVFLPFLIIGAHAAKLQGTLCVSTFSYYYYWGPCSEAAGNPVCFYLFLLLLGPMQRSCREPCVFLPFLLIIIIIGAHAAKLQGTLCVSTFSYYWGPCSKAAGNPVCFYLFLLLGPMQRSCREPCVFLPFLIGAHAAKLQGTLCVSTFSYWGPCSEAAGNPVCFYLFLLLLGSGQLSCREPIVFLGILLLENSKSLVKTHQTLHKGPVPCQIHSTPRTCAPPS